MRWLIVGFAAVAMVVSVRACIIRTCEPGYVLVRVSGSKFNDTLTDALPYGVRPDQAQWIGQPAPDFELPSLKQEANENGEMVAGVSSELIRLSSFRGKKVVCLFLSSYS